METTLVAGLLKLGAPWIMVAILLYLFLAERKRKDELADKLYDLGTGMIKLHTEFKNTLHTVEKDVEEIRRKHS